MLDSLPGHKEKKRLGAERSPYIPLTLRALFAAGTGVAFIVAAILLVLLVNDNMRRQALVEAEAKARMLLDRNLATHTYFSHELKPGLFALTDSMLSDDDFEPSWMSSTYAVREIDQYFKQLSPADYYYKEAAINARSPANEADGTERDFLEALNRDPALEARSGVRMIEGEPYFEIIRRGEVMETACLRCHGRPGDAPGELVEAYGPERSFGRQAGEVISAISIRIPLASAYAEANQFSWQLSGLLLLLLGCLTLTQYWLYSRWLLTPLTRIRDKAFQITHNEQHLGEEIPLPFGRELSEIVIAFNMMSLSLWRSRGALEKRVEERTAELEAANERLGWEIDERKRVEERVSASRDFYLTLFEAFPAPIWRSNPEGVCDYFNQTWLSFTGRTMVQEQGYGWAEGVHPEDVDRCLTIYRQAFETRRPFEMEYRLRRYDGQYRWLVDIGRPFEDLDGAFAGYIGSCYDITSLKEAEADLKRSNRELSLFSAAIEQAAESIMITDTAGAIIYVNPSFERISGYSRAEVAGQNPSVLKSGQHDAAFYREMWTALTAGQVWRGRLINRRKDNVLYTEEATITPVRNEQGEVVNYVAVKDDVTQRLALEEQLRQSQKMEAIGRLAGGVAHDFNNLLTVINGYTGLLLAGEGNEAEPLRQDVEQIRQAGERAAALTRQLLAFSRKQVLQPEVLDLNAVVTDVEKMLRRLIGENIELATRLAPNPGRVMADPGQLQQVIINLAINARDAMPSGGKLTIETAEVNLAEDYSRQHVDVAPGPYVLLAVSDTGLGVDKETLSHVFEPFFTTKGNGEGTGLGLATVHGIVKQSGGHIWAYSEPDYGTTFKIYLPRLQDKVVSPEPEASPVEMPGGCEKILVVEDDDTVRDLVNQVLTRQGYTVIEAADGKQALDHCGKGTRPVDLLLTDVVLPGINGQNLSDKLKLLYPDMKILFMSGYTDSAVLDLGVLASGVPFLQKPFTPRILAQKVREVLDNSPP